MTAAGVGHVSSEEVLAELGHEGIVEIRVLPKEWRDIGCTNGHTDRYAPSASFAGFTKTQWKELRSTLPPGHNPLDSDEACLGSASLSLLFSGEMQCTYLCKECKEAITH